MREVMLLFEANEAEIMPPTELDTALGATIGRADREVKKAIQEVRWQYLKEEGDFDVGDAPNMSLKRLVDGEEGGQLYGHCAETLPLVVRLG